MISRLRRFVIVCFILCLVPALARAQGGDERRVALIIGNSAYTSITALDNPGNDAADMSVALEGLGFEVFLGIDATAAEMAQLTQDFSQAITDADVSIFYFAGHGFQVGGQNYLVPTDAEITQASDVADETIRLSTILERMETAPGIKFVFLDACRNDPFAGAVGTVSEGLARTGDAADFLISFATQPDNVAYDGTGRNSFFTEALLSHIYTPGLDVNDLMINVRKDVLAATGGRQIPWENSSLTRQFRFDTRPDTVSAEALLWQVAADAQDPQLMALYAERYPQGAHVGDVMAFLNTGDGSVTRDIGPAQSDEQQDRLWQLARRSRMRPLVQFYLDQYPSGVYAEDARLLIASLPTDTEAGAGRICERLATHPRDATATIAGSSMAQLGQNAFSAIQACQAARRENPNLPHYTALLARATLAAGDTSEALYLYRQAAEAGDLRAIVSLGLLTEVGRGVDPSVSEALQYYERAANLGSPDGKINLAVALLQGTGIQKDPPRAIELLQEAAELGSALATFNLGVLARDEQAGDPSQAFGYFQDAIKRGESRAYLASAIMLDEGRNVPRDPQAAANMLLRGAAEDSGQSIAQMTQNTRDWSRETIAAVQTRLQAAGYYTSTIDGLSGPNFIAALDTWRNGGFKADVLTP
ncbi:MAG: caspase family protein [Pseudomonadota bacterium]